MTLFYGFPNVENKLDSWKLLRSMKPLELAPWIYLGDFNQILTQEEKWGKCQSNLQHMMEFNRVFTNLDLYYLVCVGHRFTWSNIRQGDKNIQKRLDRAMANTLQRASWVDSVVSTLPRHKLDHNLILVECYDFSSGLNIR